jgi:hypothetical protein
MWPSELQQLKTRYLRIQVTDLFGPWDVNAMGVHLECHKLNQGFFGQLDILTRLYYANNIRIVLPPKHLRVNIMLIAELREPQLLERVSNRPQDKNGLVNSPCC